MQKEQANFRIDSAAKKQAYLVLEEIGIKPADAVNMYMHYIAAHGELPFHPRIPNYQTRKTMQDTDQGIGLVNHSNSDEMFSDLLDNV